VTEHRVQRRLAAILAADVVGYSALMERAEEATYAEFERLKRELIEPSLSRYEGRLIKTTGDGALAEPISVRSIRASSATCSRRRQRIPLPSRRRTVCRKSMTNDASPSPWAASQTS
jgi:class 3 adenylate cyclase